MRLQVRSRNGHVNDSVRGYAEKRLAKLGRRVHDLTLVELVFSRERNPSIADDHTVEAVVHTKGSSIVARESAPTYEAAIDRLLDKLERQVERHRDKRTHEVRRRAPQPEEAPVPIETLERELREPPAESAA